MAKITETIGGLEECDLNQVMLLQDILDNAGEEMLLDGIAWACVDAHNNCTTCPGDIDSCEMRKRHLTQRILNPEMFETEQTN